MLLLEFPVDGYVVIDPDGTTESVDFGEQLSISMAQGLVGRFIQIPRDDEIQIMVDEEGLLKKLPYNAIASALAGQPLVGRALCVTGQARWI